MGGAVVAWFAGLVSATFLLALQVASWLATDAPLMAGVALAMLGFFAGLSAALSRANRSARALLESAEQPVFVIRLKGAGAGAVLDRLKSLGVRVRPPRETPALHDLTTQLPLVVERTYELPQGRRYALLARSDRAPGTAAPAGSGEGGD